MGGDKYRREDESESQSEPDSDSGNGGGRKHLKIKTRSSRSKRGRSRASHSFSSSSSYEHDEGSHDSDSEHWDSEDERRRRRRERKRRKEKESRSGEKEKSRKRKRNKEETKKKKKKDKKKKDRGHKGAVTNSWGKYGIIRETDMWNKRPEFTAWLAEVKKLNLESLPNWEEKQLFKDFMEDHNTATFPSKKYYNLDGYYQRKMEKEMKKGYTKVGESERTVFNDEEQRRLELQQERERRKQQAVEALKCSMPGEKAQAMKEQAQLREEMAYQYKIGNFEAAAAIQRRLDPDVAM